MGTYTELCLNGYPILPSKSAIIADLWILFTEEDRHSFVRKECERNPLVWGNVDSEDEETAHEYRVTAELAKERLEFLGYSASEVRGRYERAFPQRIESCRQMEQEFGTSIYQAEERELADLTFDRWVQIVRKLIARGLTKWSDRQPEDPLVRYCLADDFLGYLPMEYDGDVYLFVRACLEAAEPGSLLVQDVTDLVHAGYYEEDEQIMAGARGALLRDYPFHEKILVLTEGSTDSDAIGGAMKILKPNVAHFFHFMDFGGSKFEGGAARLVQTVKAFIGARIRNRVIAVFDNDTAAHDALRQLEAVQLPPNIFLLTLPASTFLKDYPTLGPTGAAQIDVNGLAASLELYLGRDVLDEGSGTLFPVQWTGYCRSLGQYQGEVTRKDRVLKRFRKKLRLCLEGKSPVSEENWSELRLVVEKITTIAHSVGDSTS